MIKILKKLALLQTFFAIIVSTAAAASSAAPHAPKKASADVDMREHLFECRIPDFTVSSYSRAVSALFKAFEKESGHKIVKGKKGKVGLKVYTNSGPGIPTPPALVDAVIEQLLKRGYKREDITIVDMSRRKLRDAGYLPRLSELHDGVKDNYKGVNVADIESNGFFDKQWYCDNSLMPKSFRGGPAQDLYNPELRKSYLPVPLFLTVDFWINLPVVTDMEGLGVCAALGNASIWNMSNNERFLKQPANASMAAAEVCAIPELRDSNIFTILTLEQGQFVGGSLFNSRCTFTENVVFLSANPVAIDYIAWDEINRYRRSFGFKPIDPMPVLFNYCKELKIGDWDLRNIKRRMVSFPQK